eukprot:1731758-Pyramimonas_sp.AAC.1
MGALHPFAMPSSECVRVDWRPVASTRWRGLGVDQRRLARVSKMVWEARMRGRRRPGRAPC